MRRCPFLIALAIGLAGTQPAPGDTVHPQAHGDGWEDDDHSYDRARRAVRRGEILPMVRLLQALRTQIPGEVVDVELEREDGRWVYEFKIVDDKGWLREVYVDAQTGEILSREHD
jgi:uncharacterized membrane protein YkoI